MELVLKQLIADKMKIKSKSEDFIFLKKDFSKIFKEPNCSSTIRQKVDTWYSFFNLSKDALEQFIEMNLYLFDGLVGENRCEVRAFYFLNLINNTPILFNLLRETLNKIQLLNNEKSIQKIATDPNFDLQIHKSIVFIIFCFILNITKETGLDNIEITNQNRLCEKYPKVSSKLAKKLIYRSKKFVSSESVLFLQRQSKKISKHLADYMKYVEDPYIVTAGCFLKCAPSFFGMRILLDRLFFSSRNILAIKINFQKKSEFIKQENLLFRFNSNLNKAEFISLEEQKKLSPKTPIYTIEGCSKIAEKAEEKTFIDHVIDQIQTSDIHDIILPSFLHKDMYPWIDHKKNLDIKEKEILLEILRLKSLPGRSIQDPSLFSISHISCLTKRELFLSPDLIPPNYLPKIEKQKIC